jgi:YesN/AraC family two-component response regulator
LVVEDEPEVRDYICEELKRDYFVATADNGKEAYDKILKKAPDLIISDVMMPVMDGLQLCLKIKRNSHVNHIPIILLTAKSRPEDTLEGMAIGADAYISKPFNTEILKSTIANLLTNRSLLKSTFSGAQQQEDKVQKMDIVSSDEVLMEKIMKVVNDNLNSPNLGVALLATEVGLSRVHVHRKLKEFTNLSPRNFIRNIRLHQAAKLLEENDLTVSEAAYATGFTNLSHFTACFKELFGVSPKEYKAGKRGDEIKKPF